MVFVMFGGVAPNFSLASSFEGNWEFNYSCQTMVTPNKQICTHDQSDSFMLYDVTQTKGHICAYHLVTGNLQRRVDDGSIVGLGPSVYGTVHGDTALVRFRSSLTGEIGEAKIVHNVKSHTLEWSVVKPLSGEDWFPTRATLKRSRSALRYTPLKCAE
jgi:hypothetical protein